MEQEFKLNLGCGKRKLPGWINVDLHNSDYDCDIRKLPFKANSTDEIMAIHVCEHLYFDELLPTLENWFKVLKPGGKIILELPCLDKVIEHFNKGSSAIMTLWALYGDPRTHTSGASALHKWCWSKKIFSKSLESVGFVDITEETPQHHEPTRDMRWVAKKP